MQYLLGMKMKGILYLHRITDNRMQGSMIKNLQLFKSLVGEHALKNVVLVTTIWGEVKNFAAAEDREQELRGDFWSAMLDKGSRTTRFEGDKASAEGLVAQLLGKRDVVLQLQYELVDKRVQLKNTTAGAFLEPQVDDKMIESQAEIQLLR